MWTSFYFLSVSRWIRFRCYGNSTWSLHPGKNAGLKPAFSILVSKIRRLRTSFLFILAGRKKFQPEVKFITAMRSVSGKSDIRKFCRENDSTFNIYIYIIYMYTYLFFISLHIITLCLTFQFITLLLSFYFSITNMFYFRRSYSCISHSIFYLQTQIHVERPHKVAINIQKDVTKRRETSAKERPTIAQIKLRIRHANQSICPSASSPECNKTRIPLFERSIS